MHTFTTFFKCCHEYSPFNREAKILSSKDIEAFETDQSLRSRLCNTLDIMLAFYGLRLNTNMGPNNEIMGFEVSRNRNWQSRFQNLQDRSHNFRRICRILKCLGELGLAHLQGPFAKCLLDEIVEHLHFPNAASSLLFYWLPVIRDQRWRDCLERHALLHLKPPIGLRSEAVVLAFEQRFHEYYRKNELLGSESNGFTHMQQKASAWFQLAFFWGLGPNCVQWSIQVCTCQNVNITIL